MQGSFTNYRRYARTTAGRRLIRRHGRRDYTFSFGNVGLEQTNSKWFTRWTAAARVLSIFLTCSLNPWILTLLS